MQIKRYTQTTPGINKYGFNVFNTDGASLPKGMFNYFMATETPKNGKAELSPYPQDNHVEIEFSMQSPTGDSSDHHNYIFPCKTMIQAQFIIDMHHNMAHDYIYALDNVL